MGYVLDDAGETFSGVATSPLSNLISKTELAKLYVSHVSNLTTGTAGTKSPVVQYSVKATIMLKDIHPLFEVMPGSEITETATQGALQHGRNVASASASRNAGFQADRPAHVGPARRQRRRQRRG